VSVGHIKNEEEKKENDQIGTVTKIGMNWYEL